MFRYASMTLIAFLCLAGAAAAEPQAAQAENASRLPQSGDPSLNGTWQLVAAVRNGQPVPANEIKQSVLVITGDHFRFPQSSQIGTAPAGTFKVNPNTHPTQIDATASEGPDAGKVSQGLYQVSGDSQIDCFAPPGAPRPTDLTAPSGSGRTLQIWQRVKP